MKTQRQIFFRMRYSFPTPPPLTWMKATGWRRKLPGPDSRRSYENQRTSHFDSDSVALHRRVGGLRDMRKLFYAAERFLHCCYRYARQLVPFVRLTPAGNQMLSAPRHCVSGRARGVCVPRQERRSFILGYRLIVCLGQLASQAKTGDF